ncbi:hypothetical protein TNCV_2204221 [Trichonephila clavipes]|nr:hypothetical protein TNCV_2204221 [Trichonephila clavipes]
MAIVNKISDHPEHFKQLALEVIDGILVNAVKIYTDNCQPGNEVADDLAKVAANRSCRSGRLDGPYANRDLP